MASICLAFTMSKKKTNNKNNTECDFPARRPDG